MYREIVADPFPPTMEISFGTGASKQALTYEKVTWDISGERLGLRYGENPDQPAALYRLAGGNLSLGDVTTIAPGNCLASDAELLQSGKHPGKINITDVDSALGILRYLTASPCAVIVKHNNPSGVAQATTIAEAFHKALLADRIAAFGGAVVCNRTIDRETAELIASGYVEVVAAPEYDSAGLEILKARKNLRIMQIRRIDRLSEYADRRFPEFRSLIDGGIVVQWSFLPIRDKEAFLIAPGIKRRPTDAELDDMLFGWLVESGVTSNSVIYVRDGVTIGIGTGEQDRVGVAEIARRKAERNACERLCVERFGIGWLECRDPGQRSEIEAEVAKSSGGLAGSVMISDAFFPKRDGVEVGLEAGVAAVLQPGGSLKDDEVVAACNEYGATMCYTGQRSFRH
jgi:phosphoribosylaminoimidazolecarboxamide formyltransferase / IMP cyclohydrolase